MVYTQSFEHDHAGLIGIITQCAHLHSDPMIYTDLSGGVVGCNEALLELLNIDTLEEVMKTGQTLEQTLSGYERSHR